MLTEQEARLIKQTLLEAAVHSALDPNHLASELIRAFETVEKATGTKPI